MRIVFVLPTVSMSGGIKVVAIYARALVERGHNVTLVSPPLRPLSLRAKVKSALLGRGWPARRRISRSHLDGSGLDHRVLDCWRPVIDSDVPDADVVIATWWETAHWVYGLSAHKGAKTYFIQGYEIFPYVPLDRCEASYRLPMHKIVVARWLQRVMSEMYGDDRVDVVPNSVDKTQFFAEERSRQAVPTVGFLYSTAVPKGLDVTLKALRELQRNIEGLRLISFGSERVTADFPLPPGTEFHFSPPQYQIRSLYSACDVWVTASRSEGFNLPAMEAMACRTPVVATRTGWPEEAIRSGENGILVDVGDVGSLTRGIASVLALPELDWRRMSEAAFEATAGSSWADSIRLFERALERAVSRTQTPSAPRTGLGVPGGENRISREAAA